MVWQERTRRGPAITHLLAESAGRRHLDEKVHDAVQRILLVPSGVREFTETAAVAMTEHRIGKSLLERLLDLGLPCEGTGDDRRFDPFDLANVGVILDLPCPRRMAMRWWSGALRALRPGPSVSYTLEVSGTCPTPGHAGPCEFRLGPGVGSGTRITELRPGCYSCELELPCELRMFGAPFDELIELVRPLRFHLLPGTLARDRSFVAETGLADCRAATVYLTRAARRWSLPVRPAVGYFVAPPYATPHCWLEFEVDGEWVTADPFLLHSLRGWGIVDPEQWPVNRSPQGTMWCWGENQFVPMEHNGLEIQPTVAMRKRGSTVPPGRSADAAVQADGLPA